MSRTFRFVMVAAVSLGLAAVPVHAQVSKDVSKCQDGTNKALGKFTGAKAKCVSKCLVTQRKAASPNFPSCFPPFADPTENACILGTLKGAEAKGGAAIAKVCAAAASCPLCYTPSTKCTDASGGNPWIQTNETNIDAFGPIVYCNESGNMNPSKDDAKCEDGISKALVKFVGAKGKCYQKCNDNLNKGKIPPGSCTPPNPSDAATLACVKDPVKGAEVKAEAAITKACPAFPACAPVPSAANLVNAVESVIDGQTPDLYCGSPSGAFLDN
jgi:hypothetical protein